MRTGILLEPPLRKDTGGEANQEMRSISNSTFKMFRDAFSILAATLREIFDENAYHRFLTRQRLTASPLSYSRFLDETNTQRARRPRCC